MEIVELTLARARRVALGFDLLAREKPTTHAPRFSRLFGGFYADLRAETGGEAASLDHIPLTRLRREDFTLMREVVGVMNEAHTGTQRRIKPL